MIASREMLSGFLSCPFWSTALQCGARLHADTHPKLLDRVQSVVPTSYLGECLSVTLLIVELWQYCVCCIRAGVTRCTLLMVLYCAMSAYKRCPGRTSI